jgi:phosphoglycolate phosphatase
MTIVPFPTLPQIAFFDWDGTLCDTRPSIYDINLAMAERYAVRMPSYEAWLLQAHPGPVECMRAIGVPKSFSDASILAFLRELLDADDKRGVCKPLYPDTISLLRYFRNRKVPQIIVSRHPHDHLVRDIENHGLASLFHAIIGNPDDTALEKDVVVRNYCQSLGVPEENAFYLGDTSHDMRLARLAGVCPVAVSHGYEPVCELAKESPAQIFGSLGDFLHFLNHG